MSRSTRTTGRGLEPLEQRAMMAADIDFDSRTGVLTITGDERNPYQDVANVRFEGDQVRVEVESFRLNGTRDDRDTRSERIDRVREIRFNALGGNDRLIVTQGALRAGVNLSGVKITYNAGAGHDYMDNQSAATSTAYGGTGNDTLHGGSAADHLYGQDNNDTIYGRGGNDTIIGGYGTDTVRGGDGNDTIYGDLNGLDRDEPGDADTLIGDAGTDVIYGGGGHDSIWGDYRTGGRDARDYLYGGFGNDTLDGDGGDDYMHGGDGDDQFYGDEGDDTLLGGWGADRLEGGADNDVIYGDFMNIPWLGDSDDWLMGGEGQDTLFGGGGNDFLQGGQRYEDAAGNVIRNADNDGFADELWGEGGVDKFEADEVGGGTRWVLGFIPIARGRGNRDAPKDRASNEQVVNWY